MSNTVITPQVVHQMMLDKYPCYCPKHWYLSIIKPKGSRFKHSVAIRPLGEAPTADTITEEDVKRWQLMR